MSAQPSERSVEDRCRRRVARLGLKVEKSRSTGGYTLFDPYLSNCVSSPFDMPLFQLVEELDEMEKQEAAPVS